MTHAYLDAVSAAAELTRRMPLSPWTSEDLLRLVRAQRLPVCFEYDGELTIASIDGVLEKEGVPPRHMDFEGVLRCLARPDHDGIVCPIAAVEIVEAYSMKYTHSDMARTRGIDLPTESGHGGFILPGHRVLCYLEDAVVLPGEFLFQKDDLENLVSMSGSTSSSPVEFMSESDAAEAGDEVTRVNDSVLEVEKEAVPPSPFNPDLAGRERAEAPERAAPEVAECTDRRMLASRSELINAFGPFTGMDRSWFKQLDDVPRLRDARRQLGQSGRGHVVEPLFCPFMVFQWLIDPKRKKGRPLGELKAWDLLETHFPKVYATKSVGDPRNI